MKVQKNNGNLQDFDIEKIKLVIGRVSDEVNQSLNSSDINAISKAIVETVQKDLDEVILHSDLKKVVFDSLNSYGFTSIADAYMQGV